MGFFSYYDRLGRLLPVSILFAAWVTVGFNILLMSLRAVSAISFSEPLMVITSGAEEDSALAIWKYIKNLPVFEDPHRLPFTASAYNWLYYAFYGELTAFFIAALSLSDSWIPTI